MKTTDTPAILAILATLAVFVILAMLWWKPIPADSKDEFQIVSTAITSGWLGALGYYFGSNQGTKHTTELLANSVPVACVPNQKKDQNQEEK